jgi:hypothetical protein
MQAAGRIKVAISLRAEIRLGRTFGCRFALRPFQLRIGKHAELLEGLPLEIDHLGLWADQLIHFRISPTARIVLPEKAMACLMDRAGSA